MSTRPTRGPLRALIFLGLAITLGSVSLVSLVSLITKYQDRIAEAKRPEDTVMVIVAARDLYQGVTIDEEDLYAVQIPARYLPEGVFLTPEHVVGRIPRERILANDFVRGQRLADPESGVGLNAVIPRGMRAISVNISDGAALSGFLNPGNYVDLLVTIQPPSSSGHSAKPQTRTLLQSMFVLGVDSRMQEESKGDASDKRGKQKPSVTLLVTADQAEQVAHAENLGEIRLSLRNAEDMAMVATTGADIDKLRTVLAVKAPMRIARVEPVVECREVHIILAGERRIELVDEHGVKCE